MRYLFVFVAFAVAVRADAGDAARFAWASTAAEKNAAAFAWASSCECGNCENPDGLKWAPATRGDPNFGRTIFLVKPGTCNGTSCTKDAIIGGWSIPDELYRPFDGRAWGKPAKLPIDRPKY